MFGQAGGGHMWPPLTSASGGPPVAPNGVPPGFNSLYPGIAAAPGVVPGGPSTAASQAHHLNQFVQPHPGYSVAQQQQQQQQALQQQQAQMQRQLGQSQLHRSSSAGSSGRSGQGAVLPGGLMLPPQRPPANMRNVELQEKRKQEADKRRRDQEEKLKAEKARENFFASSNLFEAPTKVVDDDSVENVLGRFEHADRMLNCIGVDYAPPTPAPSNHHIIGDEDDLPPVGGAPGGGRLSGGGHGNPVGNPAAALYGPTGHLPGTHHNNIPNMHCNPAVKNNRGPPSMPKPPPRPQQNITQAYPQNRQAQEHNRSMRPTQPSSAASNAMMGPPNSFRPPPPASASEKESQQRLRHAGRHLDKLNFDKANSADQDIDKIFSEMLMPPPVSAIFTPKVTKHEGNVARSAPKYFPTVHVSPPPSPIKPLKASPERPPMSSINGQHDLMQVTNPTTLPGNIGLISALSEDSESDHEKTATSMNNQFDPSVQLALKKPPNTGGANLGGGASNSSSLSKPHHTTSESSESEDSSSDDSSSDEDINRPNKKVKNTSNKPGPGNNSSSDKSGNRKSAVPKQPHQVPTPLEAPDDVDLGTSFSLTNLLTKVKKQSPGPPSIPPASMSSEVSPEDISDLLSQKRSPFPDNLMVLGAADNPSILDIPAHLSPLKESPPRSHRSSKRVTRRYKKTSSASTVPESSDDEPILEKPKPKLPTPRSHTPRSMTPKSMTPKSMTPKSMTPKSMTPKSMTPKSMTPKSMTPKMTPESPRKSRMGPKKSALAQVSASQDEEESSLNESDLVPTNKGRSSKRQSSKTKKDRKAKVTPNQTAASPALPASLPTPPASVAISNNSWSISSEDDLPKEDSDDETKDQSYGVGAKYKKSPTKGRGKKIATPQRNHEASSNHRSSGQTASQQPPAEDSATKRAAISRIFPVKKSTPNSRNGHSPAPTSVSGNSGNGSTGGGKAVPVKVIKVEEPPPVVKTDPAPILPQQPIAPPPPSTPTPQMLNPTILKRLDGRPILLCRIPLSAIETYRNNTPRSGSGSGRKRERKVSTASSTTSCNSSSNKRHKKSGKTSSVTSSAVSVTDRDNIPSQSSSEPKFEASKLVERVEPEMVKPEATHLLNLPGSSGSSGLGSARNLMPPPDKKVENDSVLPENSATGAAALLPQNNHYMADQDELQVYMTQAKKLKHEADRDSANRERQAMKYLEAVLYFALCGSTTESRGEHATAYTMYKETLSLVRHASRHPRSESALADNKCNKLAILSLRCQSLLYLRLYKLRKAELRECQSKLEDLLNQATKNGLLMSPGGSPTPSPAGSEESGYSKSSGYTSSGELPITPAASSGSGGSTLSERNMSVPHILMHQQYHYSYYLTQCHELWEMADLFTTKGQCQDFIAHLDNTCGTLTLHSSLKDLVKYTQAGLDYLTKERESIQRTRRI